MSPLCLTVDEKMCHPNLPQPWDHVSTMTTSFPKWHHMFFRKDKPLTPSREAEDGTELVSGLSLRALPIFGRWIWSFSVV
jgi:hypothetical protein